MCGIAGEISNNRNISDNMDSFMSMQSSLRRRGPDQKGIYLSENAAMIHTRLAVIDIENGKQPMYYKKLVLVYNGELYNTSEVRNKLEKAGYIFHGHSDTEVVLKAFDYWRYDCVNEFNGIFAFAVWDSERRELFMARDRIGVKPLFYTLTSDGIIFASEIKALLEHRDVDAVIDEESIAEIMLIGPGRTPGYGIFRNIKEILPAHYGVFNKKGFYTSQYWFLEDKEHTDSFEDTVEKVRFLVTDSIKRQLVSDVPVCTFLSGGLDSSIISSVADRHLSEQGIKLHTFSVTYKDNDKFFKASKFQPNSDNDFIGIMNDYLNAENHTVTLDTTELADALYDAVDARDLPGMADVDASMLLLCREIKKQGTVALSGECSDEIFGGYPWYRDKTIRETDGFPWAQSTAYRSTFISDEFDINASEYVYKKYENTVKSTDKLNNLSPLESRMKEMMKLNLDWFMQTLLDRKDRMSMYSGLEVRVPFCDYRIAEYLYSVPWEYKDYKGYEKGLLREAVKGLLPDEVLWRKKSPYPKTHNPSYLNEVSLRLRHIIENPSSPVLEIAKKSELEKLLNTDNPQPWYGQLMTTPQTIAYFIQINYWLEKYKIRII